MRILDRILVANKDFIKSLPKKYLNFYSGAEESFNPQFVIFTCMDTRLVDFLEPAMGIKRGQAKVIKNAGNSLTSPFDATIRSLVVSIFELGVREVFVIGHLDCGVAKATSSELIQKMLLKGISPDAIKMIEKELENWIDNFQSPEKNVIDVVSSIRNNPLIPKNIPIHGLLFHPDAGEIEVLVDGYVFLYETDDNYFSI